MPTTLNVFVHMTAAAAMLLGLAFYPEQPAAQEAAALRHQSAAQSWAVKTMTELDQNVAAEAGAELRTAVYQACARDIRADYSDDPAQAYGWVRTLCHY
jgi:hypothetical protein